jgi:hypothetical protein
MNRRLPLAFALGTIVAGALIVAGARGDVDRMTLGDGYIHRYVALNLTTPADQIERPIVESGTSLRYGRIGWPAILFLVSGGNETVIRLMQPIATALAAGAAVAALGFLLPRAPPLAWISLFVVPGFTLSVAGGFAEVASLALALWGLAAALRARFGWAALAFAAAMLTKELAAAVLLGAVIWSARGRVRGWPMMLWSLVPVVAWHGIVRARFGHFPLLDPYLSSGRGVTLPGVGLFESLTDAFSVSSLVVTLLHVVLGVALWFVARRSAFGLVGALASLPLLIMTPHTPWRYIGDGFRTSIFIEAFALLALIAWLRPETVAPEARDHMVISDD